MNDSERIMRDKREQLNRSKLGFNAVIAAITFFLVAGSLVLLANFIIARLTGQMYDMIIEHPLFSLFGIAIFWGAGWLMDRYFEVWDKFFDERRISKC